MALRRTPGRGVRERRQHVKKEIEVQEAKGVIAPKPGQKGGRRGTIKGYSPLCLRFVSRSRAGCSRFRPRALNPPSPLLIFVDLFTRRSSFLDEVSSLDVVA